MPRLVVFDVDGTLTDSYAVDEEAYLAALGESFGIRDPDPDWTHYEHATDRGIFEQAFEAHHGRRPSQSEVATFEDVLIGILDRALSIAPGRSPEIPGARAMLTTIGQTCLWTSAIATGAFERSLARKLRAAGLSVEHLARATSNDASSRTEIVGLAIARAGGPWERVVSVGDGAWDVRTARSMGLAFVGVGSGERRERLSEEGASHVLPDYTDLGAFLAALDTATVPRG
jgi:phosphoglycolate phosphatase-like HAD superfamily hydrolase